MIYYLKNYKLLQLVKFHHGWNIQLCLQYYKYIEAMIPLYSTLEIISNLLSLSYF